jgi:DNA-binding transcriptional regulator YiaG
MAQTRSWSLSRCARELGTTFKSVDEWRERGARNYIALACAALAYGLKPVGSFAEWLAEMRQKLNWTQEVCARQLGCAENSITAWREKGAPRYIGLACAALDAGLPPFGQPAKRRRRA